MNEFGDNKNQIRLRMKSKCMKCVCSRRLLSTEKLCQNGPQNCYKNKFRKILIKVCNTKRWIKFLIIAVIVIFIAILVSFLLYHFLADTSKTVDKKTKGLPPNPEVPLPPSASELYVFSNGAVCSDYDICSKIGSNILNLGGNAVDAALASLFCNGITTMQSLGIGGGFLMNIFDKKENKSYTLDAREVAPLAATENMFVGKKHGASMWGPLSIAVPGELLGYWEAYKRFASIPWKEIIDPSIKVCEDGFTLSKHMFDAIHISRLVNNDTHLRSVFFDEKTGKIHRVGKHIKPPKELCDTYRHLSVNDGTDFYNGTLSKLIAEDLKEIGSIITEKDLQTYQIRWLDSIPIDLNGSIMHVVPLPGGGPILGLIMNILRGYNLTEKNISTVNETILTYHRITEAFKFAFGKRSELGDPTFNNLTQLMQNMTSPNFANKIRELIDDTKTYDDIGHYGAEHWTKDDKGTSHLSVVDSLGNAVSVTSTVNFYFGSGHTGRQTGIVFNSGMDDFSTPGTKNFFGLPSGKPNLIAPKKRAISSMSPTIITDSENEVKLVIGSAGGTKIPTSVALVAIRYLWFAQNIKQAIDAPRFHHQLVPNEIQYEYGNLDEIIKGLEKKGHKTHRYEERGSAMCGIARNKTAIYANADYRKKGDVSGI